MNILMLFPTIFLTFDGTEKVLAFASPRAFFPVSTDVTTGEAPHPSTHRFSPIIFQKIGRVQMSAFHVQSELPEITEVPCGLMLSSCKVAIRMTCGCHRLEVSKPRKSSRDTTYLQTDISSLFLDHTKHGPAYGRKGILSSPLAATTSIWD